MTKNKITKSDAIQEMWIRGNLQYKLKGKQIDVYNAFKNADDDINVICCSRRFGKSYILCLLATEICITTENAIIKYACPTKTQVEEIISQIMRPILEDCPVSMKPEWKEAKKRYIFPNGAQIQIAATDNGHIENLRGGASDLCIVDEAGFATDLEYAVHNVLAPTTDTTDGKIILASTPNYLDPLHPFNTEYVLPLQESGTIVKFTIYDSPMVTDERRQKIIDRYGADNPRFRCEYLCEVAVDPDKLVLGEFTPERERLIVREYPKPPYYDAYVSMDIGFVHLTGLLFAYYDFINATIVIEDELVINGPELTSEELALRIKEKERLRFVDKATGPIEPYLRISDNNNPILLNDLFRLHNLTFIPTAKDNKDAQINETKLRIKQLKIAINPRCKNLIYHIKGAKWNKKRTGFELLKDNREENLKGGHADLVDALIYLIRNVCVTKSPYPDGYFDLSGYNIFRPNSSETSKQSKIMDIMRSIMNIRKK